LENRDVPAAWYTVHLDSPSAGTLGESAASITAGGLTVDSSYDPYGGGTALVYADSASDAGVPIVVGTGDSAREFRRRFSLGALGKRSPCEKWANTACAKNNWYTR